MSQFWSPGSLVQKFILNNFPISGRRKKEKKKKKGYGSLMAKHSWSPGYF
jgi:hypothetical protein